MRKVLRQWPIINGIRQVLCIDADDPRERETWKTEWGDSALRYTRNRVHILTDKGSDQIANLVPCDCDKEVRA